MKCSFFSHPLVCDVWPKLLRLSYLLPTVVQETLETGPAKELAKSLTDLVQSNSLPTEDKVAVGTIRRRVHEHEITTPVVNSHALLYKTCEGVRTVSVLQ